MKCPKCGYLNYIVVDSRLTMDDTARRRRLRCKSCEFRWTTLELREEEYVKLREQEERRALAEKRYKF